MPAHLRTFLIYLFMPAALAVAQENQNVHINDMHNALHYGNLITYMRLKDVVPPSSEPGFDPRPKK